MMLTEMLYESNKHFRTLLKQQSKVVVDTEDKDGAVLEWIQQAEEHEPSEVEGGGAGEEKGGEKGKTVERKEGEVLRGASPKKIT
jgi:hypothetical protein